MKIAPLYPVSTHPWSISKPNCAAETGACPKLMNLVCDAAAVVIDSGGVREETTFLGILCLTLRENAERPVTVNQGSNRLVNATTLVGALSQVNGLPRAVERRTALWDAPRPNVVARRTSADVS